jgi:hypothetical protein
MTYSDLSDNLFTFNENLIIIGDRLAIFQLHLRLSARRRRRSLSNEEKQAKNVMI